MTVAEEFRVATQSRGNPDATDNRKMRFEKFEGRKPRFEDVIGVDRSG